jgi:hypothetical protein
MTKGTKNTIATIIAVMVWIFIIYLVASIIGWSFNPGHWIGFGRFLFGFIVFIIIYHYIIDRS